MTGAKITKKEKGFSLIELLVAVAIFSLVMGSVFQAFTISIKSQRQNLSVEEILDQSSYLMEQISRSVRMAKKDTTGVCTGTANLNYVFEDNCLKFNNYQNECREFFLEGARIKNEIGDYLTSPSLQVTNFGVVLTGNYQPPVDLLQPRTVVSLTIIGTDGVNLTLEAAISQRNLDTRR
jgi:prepilin-type N-terminal cleavage/methylation domain-containing protein